MDRALPGMDRKSAQLLQRSLEKQGMRFAFKTSARAARVDGDVSPGHGGRGRVDARGRDCDVLLVAVGRRPYTDGLGARELGIAFDDPRADHGERALRRPSIDRRVRDRRRHRRADARAQGGGGGRSPRSSAWPGSPDTSPTTASPTWFTPGPSWRASGSSEEDARARGLAGRDRHVPVPRQRPRAKAMGERDGPGQIWPTHTTDRIARRAHPGPARERSDRRAGDRDGARGERRGSSRARCTRTPRCPRR